MTIDTPWGTVSVSSLQDSLDGTWWAYFGERPTWLPGDAPTIAHAPSKDGAIGALLVAADRYARHQLIWDEAV